ncbi:RidA family protein [Vibrio marisflavi]|uniref:2-iminobutanoate/2-iminopropanoate deaminase n=1 Tax=Vibrio marisflavi CECT 7928 TaxID=634439 RepID=A0ABM9A1D2_9VIBR|nr:RidA family protein [Vibrio marisflavi]CAH0537601.1 2-iminobutanoate/2-iminopropanoate deaminase [Vibrio marisflavi CECT 7928]
MKSVITSEKAPKAIGPYAHANRFEGLIFTSGQLPVDPSTSSIVEGGITAQSYMALENLKSVLEAGEGDLTTVLKTTCYLSDIADFAAFNEVYKEFFGADFPARSCFAVKQLPLGALVEIEAIAFRK